MTYKFELPYDKVWDSDFIDRSFPPRFHDNIIDWFNEQDIPYGLIYEIISFGLSYEYSWFVIFENKQDAILFKLTWS